MSSNILDFIIAKAAENTAEKYNWEIEVVQTQTRNFFQSQNENKDQKNWSDTQFKVNVAGEYQGVTISFYGLRASEAVTWREIGISYNIDTCEDNFHKVALLVSITPVAVESLKKELRLWGDRMERAMNIALDAKCRDELAKLREECHNRKRKEADKESKYLAYYTPDYELECLIFILDAVLVGIN